MSTLNQAKTVAERCGIEAEICDDKLCLYLPHESLDMKIEVASIYRDKQDGRWTAMNSRPNMTGTPMGEHYMGYDSLDEAIVLTLVQWFGKEMQLRRLGLISDR